MAARSSAERTPPSLPCFSLCTIRLHHPIPELLARHPCGCLVRLVAEPVRRGGGRGEGRERGREGGREGGTYDRTLCIVKCKIQTAAQPQHPSHSALPVSTMELHCVVGLGGKGGWRERDEGGREGVCSCPIADNHHNVVNTNAMQTSSI